MKEQMRPQMGEFSATPRIGAELTIKAQTQYPGDWTTMPDGTPPIDMGRTTSEAIPVPPVGTEAPAEQAAAFPIDDAQRLIRLAQLLMASQRGEASGIEPQGPEWEALKKIPPEQLQGIVTSMQSLMGEYADADPREQPILPQFDDPHPEDPYSTTIDQQRSLYSQERQQRVERGELVLRQTDEGKYLDGVTMDDLKAANPRPEAFTYLTDPDPAVRADTQRQVDAYNQLKNLLLEIKGKEEGGMSLEGEELRPYLSQILGLRSQALGVLDEAVERAAAEFSTKAGDRLRMLRERQDQLDEEREKAMRRKRGVFGQRELTPEEIQWINDPVENEQKLYKLFNRIFEKANFDQSVEFSEALESAGRQEWTDLKAEMTDAMKVELNPNLQDGPIREYLVSQGNADPSVTDIDRERGKRISALQDRLRRYSAEHEVREVTHNANYVVLTGAGITEMQKYTARFRNSHADFAFRKRGVMEAYRYYNQALLRVRSKYGGYLPQSAMIVDPGSGKSHSEVDDLAYKMFKEALAKGVIRDPFTNEAVKYNPNEKDSPGPNEMQDWEIDGVFGMARGLGIMMGTTVEVAAQSVIPTTNPIVSLYARPIVEKLQIFQTIQKYDIGSAKNAIFAMFLDKDKRWTRDEFEEFYNLMHHGGKEGQKALAIMNGMIEEEWDRLSRKFNVFGLGGIVSRTAWRAGSDPVAGALGQLTDKDMEWVGAGLLIEKNRGSLKGHGKEAHDAEHTIKHQLEKMKSLQPLILYQKIPRVQDAVLRRVFGKELEELGIKYLRNGKITDQKAFEDEYYSSYVNEGIIQQALKAKDEYKRGGEYTQKVDALIERIDKVVADLSVRQDAALKRQDTSIEGTTGKKTVTKRIYERPREIGREIDPTEFEAMEEMSPDEKLFVETARSAFDVDDYLDTLKHKDYRQPYILDVTGMDMHKIFWQVPGEDTMARRWGDHSAAENGAAAVTKFMKGLSHYHQPEDLIEPLEEIFAAVSDYDAGYATQLVMDLSEAAAKFYSKDWYYRLPGFVGGSLGLTLGLKKGQSFAQAVMGSEAMAWDEIDVDKLMRNIRKVKLISGENVKKLRQKTLAKRGKTFAAYARFAVPLVALGLLLWLNKEETEGQS